MKALQIFAGVRALAHIKGRGLTPALSARLRRCVFHPCRFAQGRGRMDRARRVGDLKSRVAVWQTAVAESARLSDEFARWLDAGCDAAHVQAL